MSLPWAVAIIVAYGLAVFVMVTLLLRYQPDLAVPAWLISIILGVVFALYYGGDS